MRRNRSVQDSVIIPVLVYPDVQAAAKWLCTAFGFTERLRIGTHRIQMMFGTGAITLSEPRPAVPSVPGSAPMAPPTKQGVDVVVTVRIEDMDRHYARAIAGGARILSPPTTHEFGERQYVAEDFAGHRWTFSETIRDVDPKEWGGELVAEESNGSRSTN